MNACHRTPRKFRFGGGLSHAREKSYATGPMVLVRESRRGTKFEAPCGRNFITPLNPRFWKGYLQGGGGVQSLATPHTWNDCPEAPLDVLRWEVAYV